MNKRMRQQLTEEGVPYSTIHKLEIIPEQVLKHGMYKAFGIGRKDSANRCMVVNKWKKSSISFLAYLVLRHETTQEYRPVVEAMPAVKHRAKHSMTVYAPIA